MKVVIPFVGPWKDKGEAAMLISMVKEIRNKIPGVDITASLFTYSPQDVNRYGMYGIKVVPGPFYLQFIELNLQFLKFRAFKKVAKLFIFIFSVIKNMLWALIHRYTKLDVKFLSIWHRETIIEYRDADCVVFCGGQNISDNPIHFTNLLLIIFGKILGKYSMIYANSFLGSFNTIYGQIFVKTVLNKVDLITTREETSKRILEHLGVTCPIFVTADAAFTLSAISIKDAMKLIKHDAVVTGNEIMIGITVISPAYTSKKSNAEKDEILKKYLDIMAESIDYLIEKFRAQIIFFPQVSIPIFKDDIPVSMDVFDKIKNKSNVRVLTNEYTPEEMTGMYGCMDFLIGARFHSCILSLSMNVPVIAIEYEGHKARGIMALLGLEDYVCDIDTLTTSELTHKIDEIWINKENIKKTLEKNIPIMQEKSKDNVRLLLEYLAKYKHKHA